MEQYQHNPLSVAVIGTGLMAKQMLKILIKLKRPITAIYGRSIERAQAIASEVGLDSNVKFYDSYENLLENDSCDYVYIATSNDTHTPKAIAAMKHGKHVILEKSMVQTVTDLVNLEQTINEEQRIFMEANLALSSPLLKRLGNYISNNEPMPSVGVVGTINIAYGDVPELDPNNRFFNPQLGGGMICDIGSFAVGAAVRLLGRDLTITSSDLEIDKNFNVDVRGHAVLDNPRGIRANLTMSLLEMLPQNVTLGTNTGFVVISDFTRSTISRINPVGKEPLVNDIADELVANYNLNKKDFLNYRDIALAVEVFEFENAVFQGFEKCYKEDLTHFEESKSVTRILAEIYARALAKKVKYSTTLVQG